jgi:hypothetical protein
MAPLLFVSQPIGIKAKEPDGFFIAPLTRTGQNGHPMAIFDL